MIPYPPVAITPSAQSSIHVSSYPDTYAVVIFNESPYFLNVQLTGTDTMSLAAFTADIKLVSSGFTGNIVFSPVNYLNNSNSAPPSSNAFVQTYGMNETLVKNLQNNVSTGYPLSLVRQVNSDVGNATSVTNTGYPAGNVIVFGSPAGDNSSTGATSITNNGFEQLGDNHYDGELVIIGHDSAQSIYQRDQVQIVDAGGNIIYDFNVAATNQLTLKGSLVCANQDTEILAGTANETHIVNLAGSDIAFQSPLGTEIGRFSNAGALKLPGASSSLSRIKKFTASVTTTPTFFNHGLGVIPDFVVCVPDGSAAGTFSCIVDYGSLTSTQAKLTGSASFSVQCLAIKF